MKKSWAGVFLFALLLINASAETESLDKLANDFWAWRAKYAPFTGDDVNRIERPGGVRDWSRSSIDSQRKDLGEFEARWKKLDANTRPIQQQVDYRLIGSALARVRWELDINPRWKRDPNFYIAQTLTPVVEALTTPGPYDPTRSREILTRIENIPSILQQGVVNLDKPPAPFATVAIEGLENIRPRLRQMATASLKSTTLTEQELNSATDRAADALDRFREKLRVMLPSLPNEMALGRDAYLFFLKNVALMPYSPEELLAMGRLEWNRAVAFEAFEKNRNKNVPPLKIADNIDDWIKDAAAKELQIRKFLEDHGILTVPNWVQRYTLRPMPEYLRALQGFGEMDDFTSPSRLNENCIRYVTEPSGKLGYFWQATAEDPRPIIVHEGIPGHYFQLCLSWKHDDPIRVEVDVKLALGEFTLDQAAKYLQEKVPMDEQTARQEAIAFATGPGQAITYQIGKLQIIKFLADGRMREGGKFNLRSFHDFVWKNGNVPIALQEWELLGEASNVPK